MGLITGIAFVIYLDFGEKTTAHLTALCVRVVVKLECLTSFTFLPQLVTMCD